MTDSTSDRTCPRCGGVNPGGELVDREYRCGSCGLELAHLDFAANGAIRGVFGWLLQPGDVIADRYRIGSVLGKGGFGVTYLVEDLRVHGKKRALKEIPELLFDEHETRLLGRLQHPAIPDITDRLNVGGMVYLVLEFGGSRTLRTEQERLGGRIPVAVLLPWAEQICDALTYLHAQQPPVVHRDLKPENVLLDDNNRVMLIDFGIAKESSPETVTRTLGRAVTHGFSPPEQVLGTGTDARSDVYALGAILYSTLTGQVPTPAHERVVGKVLEPASHYAPDIPPLLDKAILQALELNINLRQQSIEELARVLGLVRSGAESARTVIVTGAEGLAAQVATAGEVRLSSVQLSAYGLATRPSERAAVSIAQPSPPAKPQRKRRGGALVAALVLIGAAIGGGWWWQQQGPRSSGEVAGEAPPGTPDGSPPQGHGDQAVVLPESEPSPATSVPDPGEQQTARVTPPPVHTGGVTPVASLGATPSIPEAALSRPQPPSISAAVGPPAEPSPSQAPETEGPATGTWPEQPAQTASLPPSSAVPGHGAPAVAPRPVSPRWPAADLPSVFSHEQAATLPQGTPSGSLMDLFESHRGRRGEEPQPPASEPAPPVAERAVDTPVDAKPKPKPKPAPAKPTPVQSQDGWAIIPKGARKTD